MKTYFLPLDINYPPITAPVAFPHWLAKLIKELLNLVHSAFHPSFAAYIDAVWLLPPVVHATATPLQPMERT